MIPASECLKKEKQQNCLLEYLMLKLAPVLVKLKPSSLLSLCNGEESSKKNHYDLWREQKEDITRILGISFKELKDSPKAKQVLFYNPEILFATITQPENFAYLERFGYSSCQRLEDYLELLKIRICTYNIFASRGNSFSFPHEIGIFLGYPLKDVRGFTEKGNLPLTFKGYWRVFGRAQESVQLMQLYRKAERVFLSFMENQKNPVPYIERISAHFRKFTKDIIAIQLS